jgi:pyruvate dehydrogenase E2 component (dihydrolipoamide acetyltransferase)
MPDGVLIPSLEDANRLSLCETARQRNELVEAARRDRRVPTHSAIAATSLSNLGPSRVDAFSAIIAPPQSSILSVGRLAQRPFVVDGQLCARPTLQLTLTVDHRVLDGAPAAEFLGRIVDYLEAPAKMLYADLGLRTKAEAR